jgi:RimJ/RimL family protein N-acetyltransferase
MAITNKMTPHSPLPLNSTQAATFFQSTRLIYRAVDLNTDTDFVHTLRGDPAVHLFGTGGLSKPRSRAAAKHYAEQLTERLLGVIVCLKPSTNSDGKLGSPVPIGTMALKQEDAPHHRSATLGIAFLPTQQGKGYGSEAIQWLLQWGFESAGLHRIESCYFSWNEDAGRLYRKLGFREEGRRKECFWFNGGWGDAVITAVLEHQWRRERDELARV